MIKKLFTFLCLCTLCIGSAWGEEKYIELCTDWGKTIGYTDAITHEYSLDGGSFKMTLSVNGVYRQSKSNTYFQMNQRDGYFKNTTALPGKITKIETTWSAAKGATKCYFAKNAEASSSDETVTVTAATSVTYTPPTEEDFFYFNLDVKSGSGSAQLTSCKVYYEKGDIQKHQVIWNINGNTDWKDEVEEGANITFPSDIKDIAGKKFVGWSEGIYSNATIAPSFVHNATMGKADITYYAVFATQSGSSTTKTLDFESSTNSDWTYSTAITRTEAGASYFANSGSYYGLLNSNVQIKFNEKVNVTEFSYYCVRRTTNANTSIKIQTSVDGSTWTDAETTSPMWSSFNSDGKTYKKVSQSFDGNSAYYVRLNITTGAYRQVDDISITYGKVTYSDYSTTVSVKTLIGIEFGGNLAKTEYAEEEVFNPAGITVLASYEGEVEKTDVTSGATFTYSTEPLALGTTKVSVSATYEDKNCGPQDYSITVNPIPTYTVTIVAPENGTLSVKNGESSVKDGDAFRAGTVLNIEATPNGGYKFEKIQIIDASEHNFKSSTKEWPLSANNTTIKAIFNPIPQYTINYKINGVNVFAQENVYEGTTLEFPTVDEFGGKVFIGWTETEIDGETDDKPTIVEAIGLTATQNATYYAVFAKSSGSGDAGYSKVTSLEAGDIVILAIGTDSPVTGVTGASTNNKDATVSGNSSDWMLFTVVAGTGENSLKLYLQNGEVFVNAPEKAFRLTSDGSEISTNDDSNVISGNYMLMVNPNNGSPLYRFYSSTNDYNRFKIWKYESGVTYSEYCTTIATNVTIASSGWSSFSNDYAVDFSKTGLKAYVVTNVEGTKVTYKEVTQVPALTGVVLNGTPSTEYSIPVVASAEFSGANLLLPGMGETVVAEAGYYCYGLSNGAWKQLSSEGAVAKGKAYLKTTVAPPTENGGKFEIVFEGEPTGIENVQGSKFNVQGPAYNLNGIRVNENYKGLVIMNGKKYLNK